MRTYRVDVNAVDDSNIVGTLLDATDDDLTTGTPPSVGDVVLAEDADGLRCEADVVEVDLDGGWMKLRLSRGWGARNQ